MKFHPATQIVVWVILVAMLQLLKFEALLVGSFTMLLIAILVSAKKFAQLLRRTRWIMLSLMLIYAWTTPGQPMFESISAISPTQEGVYDGLSQLGRLLAALAGLAVLLDRLHRMQLIAGLYTLFAPLRIFPGLRERFAVRLALTLHYAEVAMLRKGQGWRRSLDGLFEPQVESTHAMELPLYRFGTSDVLLLTLAVLMLGWSMR